MLTQYWKEGIIYSKESLSYIERQRLIKAKVPFIIPEKQLYLPFMGMDLKELFPPERKKTESLSPSAQVLVLGKLYKKSWINLPPSKISEYIKMTNMSIGRAFKDLELHNIASVKKEGRIKTLQFNSDGNEI